MTFANPELIHLAWPIAAITGVLLWMELRRNAALSDFVSAIMQRRLSVRPTRARRLVRVAFMGITMTMGMLAMMRPQTKGVTQTVSAARASADIMVVLDVSRSMLAEDAAPNRLARAKAEVSDMLDALLGHRVGLVAFAGRAVRLAPLTSDYSFFRMILRGADPKSVSRGGTRIGDALRVAIDAFSDEPGSKMILLITDGEDHESYPEEAAKAAMERGIRIVSIGFGSEAGSQILLTNPDTGARGPLLDDNKVPVVSRLDGELLRKIALTTEGAYIPAGVSALDLAPIVEEHIVPIVREQGPETVRIIPGERYPWFVLGMFLSLLFTVWLGATRGADRRGL